MKFKGLSNQLMTAKQEKLKLCLSYAHSINHQSINHQFI